MRKPTNCEKVGNYAIVAFPRFIQDAIRLIRLCALVDLEACVGLVGEGLLPRLRDVLLVAAADLAGPVWVVP